MRNIVRHLKNKYLKYCSKCAKLVRSFALSLVPCERSLILCAFLVAVYVFSIRFWQTMDLHLICKAIPKPSSIYKPWPKKYPRYVNRFKKYHQTVRDFWNISRITEVKQFYTVSVQFINLTNLSLLAWSVAQKYVSIAYL